MTAQAEKLFQQAVITLSKLFGWKHYHTFDSRISAKGFPDLVLVKPPRVLFAELKRDQRKPTQEQEDWLASLAACPGVETYLWTPDDWDEIERTLG